MRATTIISLACQAGSAESTKPWPNAGSSGTANAAANPPTRAITPARAGPLHAAIAIAAKSAETIMNRAAKRMLAVEARPARKMPSQPASSDPTTGGRSANAVARCARSGARSATMTAAARPASAATIHGHSEGAGANHSLPASVARCPSTTSGIDHPATLRGPPPALPMTGLGRRRLSCQAKT